MGTRSTIELPTTAAELGHCFDARLLGDAAAQICRLAPLRSAETGVLAYLADRKYRADLLAARGGVVLTREELAEPELPVTFLVVSDPQAAFAAVARTLATVHSWRGVSKQASIHPDAVLGEDVHVGPFAVIESGARIGRGTRIFAHAYIGEDVTIGEDCEIHPRATLLAKVSLGNRVRVFTGSVLGSEGFGLYQSAAGLAEMPQIGTVTVEDDVRIGANCTIDRATLGATVLSKGAKLDDQVHVGHNTHVGPRSILCGQVGISGSVVIEEDVVLAGQVGIGDGVRIGARARLGGQCGTTVNLKGDETYMDYPATPMKQLARIVRQWRRLPELSSRVRAIETRLGLREES